MSAGGIRRGERWSITMYEKLKYFLTIFGGTFIIAFGVYFFMNPFHIMCGSVTGLAIVLINFIPVPLSVMTFILNVICIILAFIFIDRKFGMKIIFISLLLPAIIFVFETFFPNPQSLTGSIALDAIGMITVICFGQAILFNANAASGGLDIIAKMMNKYLHMELGKAIVIAGAVTVASSYFAHCSALYATQILLESIHFGMWRIFLGHFWVTYSEMTPNSIARKVMKTTTKQCKTKYFCT